MGNSKLSSVFSVMLITLMINYTSQVKCKEKLKYQLNERGISEQSLNNYLKRAVTMSEFLTVDPHNNDGQQSNKEDDIRLIKNIGAKFIGRAIYRWGDELSFKHPEFLGEATALIKRVHSNDPDVIFQAALFEAVTEEVNQLEVPKWVFLALNRQPERRTFVYKSMLNLGGEFVNQWGKGISVPDITRSESQLWLMYLAGTYLSIGCESLHLGQTTLMGMEDKDLIHWSAFISSVRRYAKTHARRQWVLLDSHATDGGMIVNGKSLLDFNSFPLRIKEDVKTPKHAVLKKGYMDAYYGRSKGCITPSGWICKSMPYLLEFDNYGVSLKPGTSGIDYFVWGYDEITWFYIQNEEYRKAWLVYAYKWIKKNDPNGHLQMPVTRIITLGEGIPIFKNFGNNRSDSCPKGMNLEKTIKQIWRKE